MLKVFLLLVALGLGYTDAKYQFGEFEGIMYVSEYEMGGEDFYNNFMAANKPMLIPKACKKWPIYKIFNNHKRLQKRLQEITVPAQSKDELQIEKVSLDFYEKNSSYGSHFYINANESDIVEDAIILPAMLVSCRVLYQDFASSRIVTLVGSKTNTSVKSQLCNSKDTIIAILRGNVTIQFKDTNQHIYLTSGDLFYISRDQCLSFTRTGYVIYVKFTWSRNSEYNTAIDCGRLSMHEMTKRVEDKWAKQDAEPYKDYTLPDIELNTGYKLPPIGLGTYRLLDKTYETIKIALKLGYRLIDTAQRYSGEKKWTGFEISSEQEIGRAIADSDVKREDLFIVTKVDIKYMTHEKTIESIKKSLKDLKTSYLDLVLVHSFMPYRVCNPSDKCKVSPWECWRALEELQSQGLIRSIGVSNIDYFALNYLVHIFSKSNVSVVQNWFDPFIQDENVRKICKENGIKYMGYSVTGSVWTDFDSGFEKNPVLANPDVQLAAAQAIIPTRSGVLRWAMTRDVIVIPCSTNYDHLHKNLETRKQNIARVLAKRIDKLDNILGDPMKRNWTKPDVSFMRSKDEL